MIGQVRPSPVIMKKAKNLARDGRMRRASADMYMVESSSGGNEYAVQLVKGRKGKPDDVKCNCLGFTNFYRLHHAGRDPDRPKATCTHIEAVRLFDPGFLPALPNAEPAQTDP